MNYQKRLKLLRIIICLAFVAGICFSHELWFPVSRTFPRAPIFFQAPEEIVLFGERLLSIVLTASLLAVNFVRRKYIFLISALVSLLLLILFDQNRLQPWVYQYSLILLVFTLTRDDAEAADETNLNAASASIQILLAGLYIWSGIQKMNFTFSHETLPLLLAPVQSSFPSFQPPTVLLGISIALTESLVGWGLLFRKTRKLSVWLAVLMHAGILTLLIAKNYNSIVWVWNAALVPLVVVSFWRSDNSAIKTFAVRQAGGWKSKAAKFIAAASVLLPVLSFFGWWDAYLSSALYSGNVPVAVMRIDDDVFEKLPEKARQSVFRTKSGGEMILPLFEWALADLNVPVYPEQRVFRQAAHEVCETANDKSRVELIIKERPAVFDGSYNLTRIGCAQLDR